MHTVGTHDATGKAVEDKGATDVEEKTCDAIGTPSDSAVCPGPWADSSRQIPALARQIAQHLVDEPLDTSKRLANEHKAALYVLSAEAERLDKIRKRVREVRDSVHTEAESLRASSSETKPRVDSGPGSRPSLESALQALEHLGELDRDFDKRMQSVREEVVRVRRVREGAKDLRQRANDHLDQKLRKKPKRRPAPGSTPTVVPSQLIPRAPLNSLETLEARLAHATGFANRYVLAVKLEEFNTIGATWLCWTVGMLLSVANVALLGNPDASHMSLSVAGGLAYVLSVLLFVANPIHWERKRLLQSHTHLSEALDEIDAWVRGREGELRAELEALPGWYSPLSEWEIARTKALEVKREEANRTYDEQQGTLRAECAERIRRTRDEQERADSTYWNTPWATSWVSGLWDEWRLAAEIVPAFRVGSLRLLGEDASAVWPENSPPVELPALVPFGPGASLLLEIRGGARGAVDGGQGIGSGSDAAAAVRSFMLRILASLPAGKVKFLLVDPVGMGQNVASFMQLKDFDESLVGSKVWTEPSHIERELAKITEHMENVIQTYLRNDFPTIEDYNAKVEKIAEPYRLVVVMDYPRNFSEGAARRLQSIVQNGARCGVYALIVADPDATPSYGVSLNDIRQHCTVISLEDGKTRGWDERFEGWHLSLDIPPMDELHNRIVSAAGNGAVAAGKVEVPYKDVLQLAGLSPDRYWKGNSASGLRVPLGPLGARKPQYLTFGRVNDEGSESEAHALVIGRTGSGKSNLLHVIISSLALAYPPEELRLYLVDFKQGVEFKPYAEAALPHAEVIAIESEREFGLSVLRGLDKQLRDRGELFRGTGANIYEYRAKTEDCVPRVVLIVDEFQELFAKQDALAVEAAEILERLVRQGRSNGIHIILSSQSLTGSSDLRSAIRNQIAVRIALQCTEADSREILAQDNTAARLLTQPGQAIYNSKNGLVEGNNRFQVARFRESDRRASLEAVGELAMRRGKDYGAPVVFEGHEPAQLAQCKPLRAQLSKAGWCDSVRVPESWVGEPVSLGDAVGVRFPRQSGAHFLYVTRDEREGAGLIEAAVLGLAAQLPPESARFLIVNHLSLDEPWGRLADALASVLPHDVRTIGRRELPGALDELAQLTEQRLAGNRAEKPSVFLALLGLHRVRDLRLDDEPSFGSRSYSGSAEPAPRKPTELFASILRDGPEAGVHVLAWCDMLSNLNRVLERKSLREFAVRAAGPMSTEDSNRLLDDGAASKLDRPHRAVLLDEERPGQVIKFRPYAAPEETWTEHLRDRLASRQL